KKDFAAATGTLRGKDVTLAAAIDQEMQSVRASLSAGGTSDDVWPMVYGSADRARVPMSGGYGGAKLFSLELAKPTLPSSAAMNGADRQTIESYNKRDRASGAMTGVMPVIDRAEMFFQDNANV